MMLRKGGEKGLRVGAIALFIWFFGCDDGGTGPNNDPALSNLTKLNTGYLYVAYKTPNVDTKLDTVTITFDYNSSKIQSIAVKATLDSGQTWIKIADLNATGSNHASIKWIPKDAAQTTFNYFGFKECYLRIEDASASVYLVSDTFQILGAIPFILISPKGGETFTKTDSMKITYSNNQDMTAKVTVCAKAGPESVDFACDSSTPVRISQTLPIKTWVTTIVPQDFAEIKPESFDFTFPLVILLADYGPNGKRLTSGEITIE